MTNYTPARLLQNKELNDFLDELNSKSIEELTEEYCGDNFDVEMIVNQIKNYLKNIPNLDITFGGRGLNKNGVFGIYTIESFCLNLLIHNLFDKPYSEENVKKANLYKEFWLELNKNMISTIDEKISNFEKDFDDSIKISKTMNEQCEFMDKNELSGMRVMDYPILLEKEQEGATKEEIQEFNKKQSWEEIPSRDQEVICNWCKLSCRMGSEGFYENRGLINQTVMGGYHSTAGNGEGTLDDMSVYRFSLCEFCLDHLFGKFKIPPAVTEYHGTKSEPWVSAKERIERDDWRTLKQEFYENVKRHDEARNEVD